MPTIEEISKSEKKFNQIKKKFNEIIDRNKLLIVEFNEKQKLFIDLYNSGKLGDRRKARKTYSEILRKKMKEGQENDKYLTDTLNKRFVYSGGQLTQKYFYDLLKENPPIFGRAPSLLVRYNPNTKQFPRDAPDSIQRPIETDNAKRFDEYKMLKSGGGGGLITQYELQAGIISTIQGGGVADAVEEIEGGIGTQEGTTQTLIDDNEEKPQQTQSSTEPLAEFLEDQDKQKLDTIKEEKQLSDDIIKEMAEKVTTGATDEAIETLIKKIMDDRDKEIEKIVRESLADITTSIEQEEEIEFQAEEVQGLYINEDDIETETEGIRVSVDLPPPVIPEAPPTAPLVSNEDPNLAHHFIKPSTEQNDGRGFIDLPVATAVSSTGPSSDIVAEAEQAVENVRVEVSNSFLPRDSPDRLKGLPVNKERPLGGHANKRSTALANIPERPNPSDYKNIDDDDDDTPYFDSGDLPVSGINNRPNDDDAPYVDFDEEMKDPTFNSPEGRPDTNLYNSQLDTLKIEDAKRNSAYQKTSELLKAKLNNAIQTK